MANKRTETLIINEAPAVYVGAHVDSVKAAQQAILDILSAPHADESTKHLALSVLKDLCGVSNFSMDNCNFTGL